MDVGEMVKVSSGLSASINRRVVFCASLGVRLRYLVGRVQ